MPKPYRSLTRILLLSLAALLLWTGTALATGAGARISDTRLVVSDTLEYGHIVSANARGRQDSRFLSYTPGGDIRPIVSAGATVQGGANIYSVIQHAQSRGYNVLGGINADFFSFQSGIMEGIYISDGQLRSSHHGRNAVFFREDGSAFFGNPSLTFSLHNTSAGEWVTVSFFNKFRQPGFLYLMDEHFAATTRTTTPGREVFFRILGGRMAVGDGILLEVAGVRDSAGAVPLPPGYIVLTADRTSPHLAQLDRFSAGDRVTLSVSASDPRVSEARWATGGGDILVSGGNITSGWDAAISGAHPRTALGIRPDGSVILYTVDGRLPGHSIGLTLQELAEEMIALGASEVINLDGGGSTTFAYRYPGNRYAGVRNQPSGGALRNNVTYILLTSTHGGDGHPAYLQLRSNQTPVLGGSLVTPWDLTHGITVTDNGYFPLSTAGLTFARYETGAALGHQEGRAFRTNRQTVGGTITVYAENGARGRMELSVVAEPERIDLRVGNTLVNDLRLTHGDSVQLRYLPILGGREMISSQDAFAVSVSGGAAAITPAGVLTATGNPGDRGQITISAGNVSRVIPLQIAAVFADTDGHWAEGYIRQMQLAGAVTGIRTEQGTRFLPNQNVSRGEFAAMLTRLLGIDPAQYQLTDREFVDYDTIPNWVRPYAAVMFNRGYMTGRPTWAGLRFDAQDTITRAEAFTILGRLLDTNSPVTLLNRFPDGDTVPDWARTEIARLIDAGLIAGTSDGKLAPLNHVTRAEAATILARMTGVLGLAAPMEEAISDFGEDSPDISPELGLLPEEDEPEDPDSAEETEIEAGEHFAA